MKDRKRKYLIIVIVIIAVCLLSTVYEFTTRSNPVVGKYKCAPEGTPSKYTITLELYGNKKFLYGHYKDTDDNYAKGKYTYETENKTSKDGNVKFYMLKLHADKDNYVVDGIREAKDFDAQAEFALTKENGKKAGILMFVNSYNVYYCYEK